MINQLRAVEAKIAATEQLPPNPNGPLPPASAGGAPAPSAGEKREGAPVDEGGKRQATNGRVLGDARQVRATRAHSSSSSRFYTTCSGDKPTLPLTLLLIPLRILLRTLLLLRTRMLLRILLLVPSRTLTSNADFEC